MGVFGVCYLISGSFLTIYFIYMLSQIIRLPSMTGEPLTLHFDHMPPRIVLSLISQDNIAYVCPYQKKRGRKNMVIHVNLASYICHHSNSNNICIYTIITLMQWFLTLAAHWNQLGSFTKYRYLGPTPKDLNLICLR